MSNYDEHQAPAFRGSGPDKLTNQIYPGLTPNCNHVTPLATAPSRVQCPYSEPFRAVSAIEEPVSFTHHIRVPTLYLYIPSNRSRHHIWHDAHGPASAAIRASYACRLHTSAGWRRDRFSGRRRRGRRRLQPQINDLAAAALK